MRYYTYINKEEWRGWLGCECVCLCVSESHNQWAQMWERFFFFLKTHSRRICWAQRDCAAMFVLQQSNLCFSHAGPVKTFFYSLFLICVLWPNVSQIREEPREEGRQSCVVDGLHSWGADRNLQHCYNIWKEYELRDPWWKRAMFGESLIPTALIFPLYILFSVVFFLQPTICFVFSTI